MPLTLETTKEKVLGKFAIVISRYNESVTRNLLEGALETLCSEGISDQDLIVVWVPGAWEIPFAAKQMIVRENVTAVITLGCVIKGETTHDQHLNNCVSSALMKLSLEHNKPVSFGVLTVNSIDQAINRSGGIIGNKGIEAAGAAIEMARLNAKMTRV